MTKLTPKADIDFENNLWDAADELRGAVAENPYKNSDGYLRFKING